MDRTVKGYSLYFTGNKTVDVRGERLVRPNRGEVLVRSVVSAVSAGTEMLVYRGQMPVTGEMDPFIPALRQPAKYPVKYGYAVVGTVTDQDRQVQENWVGKTVFVLHPHQSVFSVIPDELIPVPSDILPEDAVFLPFMDTAVTVVMDARPAIGENAVVLGQGVIGILTAGMLARFPLARLAVMEKHPLRRAASSLMGVPCVWERVPDDYGIRFPSGEDLVIELTGDPRMLDTALSLAGYSGRVIVGSWYGTRRAAPDLGGRFHRDRITLQSSQVSTIAPAMTGRWTRTRRYSVAWDMIRCFTPSRLITLRRPLSAAAEVYAALDREPARELQAVFTYA